MVKVGQDVDPVSIEAAFNNWLTESIKGTGRFERGDEENLLHLQAWSENYCGTSRSDLMAIKQRFMEVMGLWEKDMWKVSIKPSYLKNESINFGTASVP